ncbi:Hypothetical predicted protein [Olea europaea subsp. europaea]|uniref:Uncharacterized protein n=1 Tax=Olea europaea subsp. europaea TaxID=158383 RepID=A0A8S0V7B2_OLEEU|nr:Hypothetical predicted protein [Olea europaea subsp. europaea]
MMRFEKGDRDAGTRVKRSNFTQQLVNLMMPLSIANAPKARSEDGLKNEAGVDDVMDMPANKTKVKDKAQEEIGEEKETKV